MKAVILAAGMGNRLKPLTNTIPKCLLEIEGKTLLEYSLEHLSEVGLQKVIIIVGFQQHVIKQRIGTNYNEIQITYITNSDYNRTGSMHSLSQAKSFIDQDIVVIESDLLYERKALDIILNSSYKDVILVAELLHSGDDVYVCINPLQQVSRLGKNIPGKYRKRAIGCLVGISKFSRNFLNSLFKKADDDYANKQMLFHYEESVFSTSQLSCHPIYVEKCDQLSWIEIDTEADFQKARNVVYPRIYKRY